MFNNVALDVFIGLVFIFLLYSLLATILQEIIATKFCFRSKVLEKAILRMLEDGKTTSTSAIWDRIVSTVRLFGTPNLLKDKVVAAWFYAHPLIKYLGEDNTYSKPAYLSAQNFSKVMIDLLKGFGNTDINETQAVANSINNETIFKIPINAEHDKNNPAIKAILHQRQGTIINALDTVKINTDTALFLKSLWQDSGADLDKFKTGLEKWFDDTMERCTGWYKRYNRAVLFVLGFIIAVFFNVDTIAIHRVLSTNDNAREGLVNMAISKQQQYGEIIKNLDSQKGGNDSLQKQALHAADSVYKETYQLLSKDANEAGTVLGLGRPWKDSVNFFKDSLTSSFYDKKQRLSDSLSLFNKLTHKRDSGLNRLNSLIKSSQRSKTFQQDTANLNKEMNEYAAQMPLIDVVASQQQLAKMNAFEDRAKYIHSRTACKLFVYAPNQNGGLETFIGWLLTAWALCLGAPFWFDMLNKLISLRGTGTKIDPSASGGDNTSAGKTTSAGAAGAVPVVINNNPNPVEEAVG
ncbi:hypothetical protein [Parafilimonas sp.]|uniref:hypothetical protein n=1 Tax=Parafilimonas sp. TaxID=1969739 RepID=UPI0039E35DB2